MSAKRNNSCRMILPRSQTAARWALVTTVSLAALLPSISVQAAGDAAAGKQIDDLVAYLRTLR
jgi:hypothetical protein